tara:strand:+ start:3754 stop:3858 length:105 start_codon:yes stop_codon:yes gene_type:complete
MGVLFFSEKYEIGKEFPVKDYLPKAMRALTKSVC